MALYKGECLGVRAAALRFLAVAMTVSSSQAAQEAQLVPLHQQDSGPPNPCSPHLSAPCQASQQACSPAGLTAAALAGLELAPGDDDGGVQLQAPGQRRSSLAGPLLLQSNFAARQYAQGVWDFGVEQLLLQDSFWEQVPVLLQVQPMPCAGSPLDLTSRVGTGAVGILAFDVRRFAIL